jgi:isorenieratene synthase
MERAAASGALAANAILQRHGARPGQIWSVPPRGLLAGKNF